MISFEDLVTALRPSDDELRDGSIAGCIGSIGTDLSVTLPKAKLTAQSRSAARDLIDARVIVPDASGRLRIARLPVPAERKLIRQALGLDRRYEETTNA